MVERLTYVYETDLANTVNLQQENTVSLRHELEDIKRDVRLMASLVGGVSVRKKKTLAPLEQVEISCPQCGNPICQPPQFSTKHK